MAQSNKAATTAQVLLGGVGEHLLSLAKTLHAARTVKAEMTDLEDKTKRSILAEFGYGLFDVPGFEVHTQQVPHGAETVIDEEALNAFLVKAGKEGGIRDFLRPNPKRKMTDRVNVEPTPSAQPLAPLALKALLA